MVPVLILRFVALWYILRGDLFYVLLCVILFLCFAVLLALRKRELVLVLFVRLFDLRLFGFVCFLFLLVSGKGCGLCLWNSLDFSLTFFFLQMGVILIPNYLTIYGSLFLKTVIMEQDRDSPIKIEFDLTSFRCLVTILRGGGGGRVLLT